MQCIWTCFVNMKESWSFCAIWSIIPGSRVAQWGDILDHYSAQQVLSDFQLGLGLSARSFHVFPLLVLASPRSFLHPLVLVPGASQSLVRYREHFSLNCTEYNIFVLYLSLFFFLLFIWKRVHKTDKAPF